MDSALVIILAFLPAADKEDKKLSIGSSTVPVSILLKFFYIWLSMLEMYVFPFV